MSSSVVSPPVLSDAHLSAGLLRDERAADIGAVSTRVSVLINCYNCDGFIADAVRSAELQTRVPDEIVVVDDGSTDSSAGIIDALACENPRVRTVHQRNGGQMAAINAGLETSTGDIVFFLDGDDVYRKDHVASVLRLFERLPDVGFVYTAHCMFGDRCGIVREFDHDRVLGCSALAAVFGEAFVGSVTSTLAMRRSVATQFLPLPAALAADWRIRADNVLTWGASAAGVVKAFLAEPTVSYRVHDANRFARRRASAPERYQLALATHRCLAHLQRRFGLEPTAMRRFYREFRTVPAPTWWQLRRYLNWLSNAQVGLADRAVIAAKMFAHWLRPRGNR